MMRWYRRLFRRERTERQLDAELRFHVEQQVADYIATGMSPEEARRRARLEFGGLDQVKEECRDVGAGRFVETLIQDIRFGLRQLRRNPGFTAVAIVTLALGIGANTAIFSVVNAALLRPLPYQDPSRLTYIWSAEKARGINRSTVSIPDLRDWRQQSRAFDGMAGWWSGTYNLSGSGEPQQVGGWTVSPNFFRVLGAKPELGRTFTPDEEEDIKDRVVVLSHSLWMGAFGGDRTILGRTITLDGEPQTVVGVMPAEFSSPFPNVQLWVPWPSTAETSASRGDRFLRVVARLKPDITIERAQADMDTVARRLAQTYQEDAGVTAYLVPASLQITGSVRPALLVLLGAVGFVLLIGCANLANLLLARSAAREKEFAVRAALGAGRFGLVRQLLTECVLLSVLGGAFGILLALPGIRYLHLILAAQIPRAGDIGLDARVLLFTLGLSVLTGIAFGLYPALQSFKGRLNESLREGGRGCGAGVQSRSVRNLLVVSEVALALVLLVGAGLLVNSFQRLSAIDPGFNPDKVLTCQVSLPSTYKDPQIVAFFHQLLDRLRALPGVNAAGATMTLPLENPGGGFWGGLNIKGHTAASRESIPIVSFVQVTPGYFRAMGIPLRKGRDFNDADNSERSPKVAIINTTLAHRFFSDQDPIGKRISMGEGASKGPWLSIVGVVGDTALESLTDPRFPQVFSPHAQGVEGGQAGNMELVLRSSSDPSGLAVAVRNTVHELDRDQPVAHLQTLHQVVSASLASPRLNTVLLGAFAGLALLLAAVGIYGVIAYSTAQRTHEIGIRMALGAQNGEVLRMIIGQGLRLTMIGLAVGIAVALVLTRFLASLLYDVRPTDPTTFIAVSVILAGVSLLACYIPARRATKVDPMVALRHE